MESDLNLYIVYHIFHGNPMTVLAPDKSSAFKVVTETLQLQNTSMDDFNIFEVKVPIQEMVAVLLE